MQIHIPSSDLFMDRAAGQPFYTNKAVSDADDGIRATTFEVSEEALAAESTSATHPPTPSPISDNGEFEAGFMALLDDFSKNNQITQHVEETTDTVSNKTQAATSSDNFEPQQFEGLNFVDYDPCNFRFPTQQGHNFLNLDAFDDSGFSTQANTYQNNTFPNDPTKYSLNQDLSHANTSNTHTLSDAKNFSAPNNLLSTASAHGDHDHDQGSVYPDMASYNAFIQADSSIADDFGEGITTQPAQTASNAAIQSTQFQADSNATFSQPVDANSNPLDDLFGTHNKFQNSYDGHVVPTAFNSASSDPIFFEPVTFQNVDNFSGQYDTSQPTRFASPADLSVIAEDADSMCYSTPGLDSDTIGASSFSNDHVSMPATPPQVAAILPISLQTVHDTETIDNEPIVTEHSLKLQNALPADHDMLHESSLSPVRSDFGTEVEGDTEQTAHPTTGGKTSWPGKNGAPLSPTTSESDNESSATVFEDPEADPDNDSDAKNQEEDYEEDSSDVDYDEDAYSEYDDEANNSDSDQGSDTEPAKHIILHGGEIIYPANDEDDHEEENEEVDVPD